MKTLFYNGTICDIQQEQTNYYHSLLTEDGFIKEINPINPTADQLYDLQGNILTTSFIDAHSHLSSYANSFLQVNLENCTNFNDIASAIQAYIKKNDISNEWIICNMLDPNNLQESIMPNNKFLDSISNNPIVICHQNGHCGCFNTHAMQILKIDSKDGILQESEYMKFIEQVPMPSFEKLLAAYKKAQLSYLHYGITTIQEGIVVKPMIAIYQELMRNHLLFLDTVVYPDLNCYEQFKKTFPKSFKQYDNHLKIGGIKIILDGSPQSKTAWMQDPYIDGTYGFGVMTDEQVKNAIQKAVEDDIQLIAHCNGSQAIEQYLSCLEQFDCKSIKRIRPVIIHSQFLKPNMLDRVKKLGAIPSFFIGHIYHFGDLHIKNMGLEQAKGMSIALDCIKKDIPFTFHQDTPVTEPDCLESIWVSMKRTTKNGILLDGQQLNFNQAFQGVTRNAAYQYFEEQQKGSLEIGKRACFIILDKGSLSNEVKDYKILDTIY